MQLTKFADYGLRTLMVLAMLPEGTVLTIAQLSLQLEVSENHLVKLVHMLGKKGWVRTVRGVGGGVFLLQDTRAIPLGVMLQQLEANTALVDCNAPPCRLRGACQLKTALNSAMEAFFALLNQYCLQDLVSTPEMQKALTQIIQWPQKAV